MKNLAIGTEVNYTLTSIFNSPIYKESKVVRFHDNYVWLENGDKMFSEALSVNNTIDCLEQEIEKIKNKLDRPMFDGKNNENLKHYLEQKIIDLSK
tara:strand:+ start:103 stop:390 length:288 start_codon:yes stop_codon:yes gene_type:complete